MVALVGAVESWFRVFPGADEYETHSGFVVPDPDLIWKLKPTAEGPLATNELGLRDTPYRADADVKILLLGDSVAWGNGVHDLRKTFPYRLERRLEARDPQHTYEVINAGVPGYSTFQQRDYLVRDGLTLEPDAVVLQFCLNDVVERYNSLAAYGGNTHFLGVDTRAAVEGVYGTLLRSSRAFEAAVRAARRWARGREEYRSRNLARENVGRALERAWARTLDEIDGIRVVAAREELPLLIVIAPFRFQVEDPASLRQPQDRVISYAREHSLPHVDLLDYLVAQAAFPAAAAFNDESHFSERGHAFVAEVLVEPVARLVDRRALN